jgi:asparagine synthase (glutamine-hydrolysing)
MPRKRAERELLRMVHALRHESFYEVGTWIDESLGVYVGWCAQTGSFSDGMPLRSEDGAKVLIFSGEEYPEPGTALRLKHRGHDFDVDSAEYLVHLAEDDAAFPASLNGRFHGLLMERALQQVVLFNDRYGLQRIYYHESEDGFYFAGEAKAILAVQPELRRIDPRSLGEFVSCGCVLENRTLFDKIHVLPPASKWSIRNGVVERKGTYFEPIEWEQQPQLSPEAYYRELREVFSRNLSRYFEGREAIGMSLTGGLDTRMIMAWQKPAPGSLPCYTFGGAIRDCQDVVVARRVASLCEQTHSVIRVDGEFLASFPKYAERAVYLTDGCVEVNRAADLYVNQIARSIAPVRMTGNYGGEVMRRIRAFKPVKPLPGLYCDEFAPYIHQAETSYSQLLNSHPLSFAVFQQAPWHHFGLLALEQTQLTLRSPYLDNDFVKTVFRAPDSSCANADVCLRLIAEADPALRSVRTDRGRGGTGGGMAATRVMLEFQFKAEYAWDYGMPQWMAPIDHFLSPIQPERMFLGRHKFAHFRIWYRDVLSDYVHDLLLDSKSLSRSHIERSKVKAIVNGHLTGKQNWTLEIHKLLTVELIHRLLLEPASGEPQLLTAAGSFGVRIGEPDVHDRAF